MTRTKVVGNSREAILNEILRNMEELMWVNWSFYHLGRVIKAPQAARDDRGSMF